MVKSQGYNRIFGGFTDIAWKKEGKYQTGNGNSFIFSLREDGSFVKFKCKDKDKKIKDSTNNNI